MTSSPIFFTSRTEFRDWLAANGDSIDELWVGYYKVDAERTGITYGESVEEAICAGWIDGRVKRIDDETYKRRFTPRNPGSKWSRANTDRARAMIDAGLMLPAGMALVDAAKESGEWSRAYRLADEHDVPAELEAALRRNETAWENFRSFSNSDQYAFIAAVRDAKTGETRRRRIKRAVELAAAGRRAYGEDNRSRL